MIKTLKDNGNEITTGYCHIHKYLANRVKFDELWRYPAFHVPDYLILRMDKGKDT